MKKNTLPLGMHDKLFKRAKVMYQIERKISDLLIEHGFYRIETPTLEHYQVFSDTVTTEHYHLFDRTGELLALRPDITSQIGRVIASTRVETPIKFSYSGKVFNYHEEMRGLTNEHTQAGVEIVGYPQKQALLEAIRMAKLSLEASHVLAYQFEFSHASILQTIFDGLQLTESELQTLKESIKEKNITKLNMFTQTHPSQFDALLKELPYLFGNSQTVLARAKSLTQNQQILDALDEIETYLESLGQDLVSPSLDLAQIPNMPYYTGLMFKVFGEKVPDHFVSGGVYDKLFERFGATELTAVGWAIDIDSVYQAIKDQIVFEKGDL